MRPKVLFLTPRLPYPLVGGDRVKAYHLLLLLTRSYDVTCVSFFEGGTPKSEWLESISSLGIDLKVVPLSQSAAVLRVAWTMFSGNPLEIQYYMNPRFRKVVEECSRQHSYDLVIAFFMRTAEYARIVHGVPRILIAEDARVLLQERATASFSIHPGYLMRWLEGVKLRRYEPRIVNDFDLTTYVSPVDRARILEMNPNARTAILTNGVDLNDFPFRASQSGRTGLVFAGKMDVLHNVRMAVRIVEEIMPRLRGSVPGLTCTIVGKAPSSTVRRLASSDVRITGEVPHVRDEVSAAAVFIHPQKIGAGIQNKLLEAMALGTPVVTTPVGISGIAAVDGVHCLIGSTTEELAAACARLFGSEELRTTLARNARKLIEEQHTWEIVGHQLDTAIARSCITHSIVSGTPRSASIGAPQQQ